MTKAGEINEYNPQLIDTHWIVESRDKKGEEWYQVGGRYDTLNQAAHYRDGHVLYKPRYRKARIVEITKYRKIVQTES